MAELKIASDLWDSLKAAADRQGKRPDALARRALREFLERLADEELIDQSQKAASSAPFQIGDTEKTIRKYRQQRKER